MKIFIPFKIKDIGGTSTFANIFSQKLIGNNFDVTFEFKDDYDVLFIIADCPLQYVLHAKINGKKIIQRLDGIYHRATPAGWLYPIYNLKMQIIHNFFADSVIYQSNFSKTSCEKFLGKRKGSSEIIYNGVEIPEIEIKKSENNEIRLITFAKFRRKDQIIPIIEAIKLLPDNYTLDIYGSFEKEVCDIETQIDKVSNISYKGKMPHGELLKLLPQYDIFLFSDQSACPNSVLEAMAAGLVTVAYNRGSIEELIKPGYNGEVTSLNKHNPFLESYPFSTNNYIDFKQKIELVSRELEWYKKNSLENVMEKFSLNKIIQNYITTLNK